MASYYPMIKNSAQRIVFPILDADGDPVTGAAADSPDSEYSLDGGSFSDCNDEITEIATSSGVYYLDLLAGETNGDVVCIQVKTATATTKTTVLVFYTSAQSLDTVDTNIDTLVTRIPSAFQFTGNYVNAQIKATDDIDLSATQKTSVNTEVDNALDTAIPGSPTADSINDVLKDLDGKFPTNYIMGSAVQTDKDDDIDAIKTNFIAVTGTADSGTSTTLVDDALTQGDNYWNDMLLVITGGTNIGQARRISDFVAASDEITVDTAFDAAIDNTSVYAIILDRQAAGGGGDATAANQTLMMGTGFDTATDSLVKIHDDHVTHLSAAPSTHAAADVWTAGSRELSTPNNYKADVSALALEATLTDIKGAGFATGTDSLEAIRDRGDAEWMTATGFSTHAAADVLTENVEGTRTVAEELRLMSAALAGKSSGGGTATLKFRDIDDSKDRITATVDSNGNRTAVTLDDS